MVEDMYIIPANTALIETFSPYAASPRAEALGQVFVDALSHDLKKNGAAPLDPLLCNTEYGLVQYCEDDGKRRQTKAIVLTFRGAAATAVSTLISPHHEEGIIDRALAYIWHMDKTARSAWAQKPKVLSPALMLQ